MTAAQVFPHSQQVVDGMQFTRVAAETDEDCSVTANGAFAAALVSDGCTQVIRATFVDSSKRYAITAGVAVLPSGAAARSADDTKQFGPDIWFTGLDGPAGSGASIISKTVGLGYDVLYQRFIFYALATYSDGHNPTGQASQIQALTSLGRSFAMLAGQPVMAGG